MHQPEWNCKGSDHRNHYLYFNREQSDRREKLINSIVHPAAYILSLSNYLPVFQFIDIALCSGYFFVVMTTTERLIDGE